MKVSRRECFVFLVSLFLFIGKSYSYEYKRSWISDEERELLKRELEEEFATGSLTESIQDGVEFSREERKSLILQIDQLLFEPVVVEKESRPVFKAVKEKKSKSKRNKWKPGKSYWGENKYIEYIPGNLPVIITVPHGGDLIPKNLPRKMAIPPDANTLLMTRLVEKTIRKITGGGQPHIVINHLHKSIFGGPVLDKKFRHEDTDQAYKDYHHFIEAARKIVKKQWKKGHYFEMHATIKSTKRTELGYAISGPDLNKSNQELRRVGKKWNSSMKQLANSSSVDFAEIIRGETSLGGLLMARGWKTLPSPKHPSPGKTAYFTGGEVFRENGSNNGGVIDATHIENHADFISRGGEARCKKYAKDLGESMCIFIETYYGFELADWKKKR